MIYAYLRVFLIREMILLKGVPRGAFVSIVATSALVAVCIIIRNRPSQYVSSNSMLIGEINQSSVRGYAKMGILVAIEKDDRNVYVRYKHKSVVDRVCGVGGTECPLWKETDKYRRAGRFAVAVKDGSLVGGFPEMSFRAECLGERHFILYRNLSSAMASNEDTTPFSGNNPVEEHLHDSFTNEQLYVSSTPMLYDLNQFALVANAECDVRSAITEPLARGPSTDRRVSRNSVVAYTASSAHLGVWNDVEITIIFPDSCCSSTNYIVEGYDKSFTLESGKDVCIKSAFISPDVVCPTTSGVIRVRMGSIAANEDIDIVVRPADVSSPSVYGKLYEF